MTGETKKNGHDARYVYADIIDLPHHRSATHPHMSLYDRSAQFAPFAALTGYNEMIAEEARLTGMKKAQDQMIINAKLAAVQKAVEAGEHPLLGFTVFVPDLRKEGGEYIELSGTVKRVDLLSEAVILYAENEKSDGLSIEIENLRDIYGETVDYLDNEII